MDELRRELLEREEAQYRLNESLMRSLLKLPNLTQEDVDFHIQACKDYLDAGYEYDGELTPFVIGFRGGQQNDDT